MYIIRMQSVYLFYCCHFLNWSYYYLSLYQSLLLISQKSRRGRNNTELSFLTIFNYMESKKFFSSSYHRTTDDKIGLYIILITFQSIPKIFKGLLLCYVYSGTSRIIVRLLFRGMTLDCLQSSLNKILCAASCVQIIM